MIRAWPVQDAGGRFDELLDACVAEGPQVVTQGGEEVAVLVSVEEWRRLRQAARPTIKEVLLSEKARGDLPIPDRKQWRWGRKPPTFD